MANTATITTKNITAIAKQVKSDFGMSAEDINNGYCAEFAKKMLKAVGYGKIIYTKNFELIDELPLEFSEESKYKGSNNYFSHCVFFADGMFYDAFNTHGRKYESQMKFRNCTINKYGFANGFKKGF